MSESINMLKYRAEILAWTIGELTAQTKIKGNCLLDMGYSIKNMIQADYIYQEKENDV